jgi:PKD repeat protein
MKTCKLKQTGLHYVVLFALLVVCIIPASAVVQPASGGNTLSVSGVILPQSAPVAGFIGTPTSGSAPLKVTFMDKSTGVITAYAWDFDNNGVIDSTAKNPTYTYTKAGTYTVKLKVTGPGGSDDEIKTKYITVTTPVLPPVARFTQDEFIGRPPLTVHFTDHSRNDPTSYFWQFGDGSSSTEKNPTHQFTQPRIYFVREKVTNAAGSDTAFRVVVVLRNGWWWNR